ANIQNVRKHYNLKIGERSAETIKLDIGIAGEVTEDIKIDIRGRGLLTGLPQTITISAYQVADYLQDSVDAMVDTVKQSLEKPPPESAADITDRGIVLSGGGSLRTKLGDTSSNETKMPVFVDEAPLDSLAIGIGKSLDYTPPFRTRPNVSSPPTVG